MYLGVMGAERVAVIVSDFLAWCYLAAQLGTGTSAPPIAWMQ